MAGRDILANIGMGQKYSNQVIGKVHAKGNNLGLPGPALADTLAGLEEDVLEETGIPVRFPLDEAGADVLLMTPSADFFAEPHVDGLIGYAKVLHQAGISWTLSTEASEAANFGLFVFFLICRVFFLLFPVRWRVVQVPHVQNAMLPSISGARPLLLHQTTRRDIYFVLDFVSHFYIYLFICFFPLLSSTHARARERSHTNASK